MKAIQLIQVTPDQLRDAIIDGVSVKLEELKNNFQPKEPTEYLTLQQAADLLHVDLSTIHNWRKRGVITAHGIEGRVLLKRSEIETAIVELKPNSKPSSTNNKKSGS